MNPSSPVAQNGQPTAQPRLARDAERVPLALRAARRVVHQDGLDERAVRQAMEALLGQAAVGQAELRVVDRVEAERAVELARGAPPGSVRTSSMAAAASAPDRVARPGGRGTRARRARRTTPSSSSGREARTGPVAGRGQRGESGARDVGMASRRARRAGSTRQSTASIAARRSVEPSRGPTDGRAGTPRRSSAGRRRAGPRGGRAGRRPSRARGRRLRDDPARDVVAVVGSCDRRGQHDEPLAVGLEEAARPRQVGPDLALQEPRRLRRIQPAVGAPERPGQRRAVGGLGRRAQLARAATVERPAPGARPRRSRRRASRAGAVSSPSSGQRSTATIGPVSRPASIRIRVTPVSASPARIAAGIGVAPRWRGRSDGWRLSAPYRRSSSSAGTIWP